MQPRFELGSSTRRTWYPPGVTAVALFAMILAGCGPSQEAGFEQVPGEDEAAEDEHIAPQSQRACDLITDAFDTDQLSTMTLEEVLEEVPQLSAAARIVAREPIQEELARFDEVTFFAPLDGALPDDTQAADTDEALEEGETPLEEDAPPPETPARAYFHPDAALTVEALADAGVVDVADGGSLSIQIENDRATVERDGAVADIVCADVQLSGAVLHIVDADPYAPDEDDREPEGDIDQDETPPEVPSQLDEEEEGTLG